MGGSESLGFRSTGCPIYRKHDLFLRTDHARLYRMGTRRRQLARRRIHVFHLRIRRLPRVTHFYAIRISFRRMKSVMHVHASRSNPERSGLSCMTMDSLVKSEDFTCSYTVPLSFCPAPEEASQHVEKKFHTCYVIPSTSDIQPKLSVQLPAAQHVRSPFGPDRKAGTIRKGIR